MQIDMNIIINQSCASRSAIRTLQHIFFSLNYRYVYHFAHRDQKALHPRKYRAKSIASCFFFFWIKNKKTLRSARTNELSKSCAAPYGRMFHIQSINIDQPRRKAWAEHAEPHQPNLHTFCT